MTRRLPALVSLIVSCSCLISTVSAQSRMEADRPDQAENTYVMERGMVQLESGFIFDRYQHTLNEYIGRGVLRYGLAERVEVRVLVEDGKRRDAYIEGTAQGNYPLAIGGKLALVKDRPSCPDITLITYLELPFTSHTKEQSGYWSPAAILALEHDLGEDFNLCYNAGIKQDAFDPDHAWQSAVSLQYEASDKFRFFAEYFGQYQDGSLPLHNMDAGLMFLPLPNLQLDLSAGSGIFGTDNEFASLGFSVRLPQ